LIDPYLFSSGDDRSKINILGKKSLMM